MMLVLLDPESEIPTPSGLREQIHESTILFVLWIKCGTLPHCGNLRLVRYRLWKRVEAYYYFLIPPVDEWRPYYSTDHTTYRKPLAANDYLGLCLRLLICAPTMLPKVGRKVCERQEPQQMWTATNGGLYFPTSWQKSSNEPLDK